MSRRWDEVKQRKARSVGHSKPRGYRRMKPSNPSLIMSGLFHCIKLSMPAGNLRDWWEVAPDWKEDRLRKFLTLPLEAAIAEIEKG